MSEMAPTTLLRGSSEDTGILRWLQENPEESPEESNDSNVMPIVVAVVVAVVFAVFAYCFYEVLRFYCCKKEEEQPVESIVADNDMVKGVEQKKRRDLLEAIFSETEAIVKPKHSDEKGDIEKGNLGFFSTSNSPQTPTTDEGLNDTYHLSTVDSSEWSDDGKEHNEESEEVLPEERNEEVEPQEEVEPKEGDEESNVLTTTEPANTPKEEGAAKEVSDDDDPDNHVCAICLCDYEDGEKVYASKYCTHLFHKDCILEWLDTHDGFDCPLCRKDMVTEGELNKAAISFLGKQRMCKAVESYSTRPRRVSSSNPPLQLPPASAASQPQRAAPASILRMF